MSARNTFIINPEGKSREYLRSKTQTHSEDTASFSGTKKVELRRSKSIDCRTIPVRKLLVEGFIRGRIVA